MRTVLCDEADIRLDRWFRRHFCHISHSQLEKLIRTGQIRVDGRRTFAGYRLQPGQQIRIPPLCSAQEPSPSRPIHGIGSQTDKIAERLRSSILYHDEDVLVLNKPNGLATQGGTNILYHLDGMLDLLRCEASERFRLVHRLDKETSGVLVIACNVFAAQRLSHGFRSGDVQKTYWAVTVGVPHPKQGQIAIPLTKHTRPSLTLSNPGVIEDRKDQHAITLYRVIDCIGHRAAFVVLMPVTGRMHQLRRHMALLGTPILGDRKYGDATLQLSPTLATHKLHLHARRLNFSHPRNDRIDVVAPLSRHMADTWEWCGFDTQATDSPLV